MLSLSLSLTNNGYAANSCQAGDPCKQIKADCKDIILKIGIERADRDKLESTLNKTILDQGTQLNIVTQDRDEAVKAKDSWYHNFFILVPAGILLGGVGILYLEHR
jgi:hypothetical protein